MSGRKEERDGLLAAITGSHRNAYKTFSGFCASNTPHRILALSKKKKGVRKKKIYRARWCSNIFRLTTTQGEIYG